MTRVNVCLPLFVAVVSAGSSALGALPNQLTEYELRCGWQLLFDGESLSGWRNYQSDDISEGWRAHEGVLLASRGAGDLITRSKFEHFELSIEYRIAKGGNSGILFHVTEDGKKPWHSGPEIQLLDNANHRAKEKSGWLYQLYRPVIPDWSVRARAAAGVERQPSRDATRPAGQWNQVYLRVCDAQCEVAVNGVSYFLFRKGDADWNQRVAASKFARFPNFGNATSGHLCLQEHGSEIAFRNIKVRELLPDGSVKQQPIDGKLSLLGELAFPRLEWDGWEPVDEQGRTEPPRIMELTHVGDDRLFAVTQRGQIFGFENDPKVTRSALFLDIRDKVGPWQRHNEEGLLGLAFHPRFEQNGYFYVYYSPRDANLTSRVSRFRLSADDPNRADLDSELVLIDLPQPFHNHNGGSIQFGEDGYLYIGLGDGGDRNDPFGHGQDLSTLLGSILRIDVNRQQDGRPYGIPKDNPFVGQPNVRPEIYAFGFRNVWRLAMDSKTGDLWAADVGQDRWEEINLVHKGGNYGWSIREGTHLFGNAGPPSALAPVEPVWEYDHQIGKSITGGRVYNGTRVPELIGKYVYADYVTGRVWALEYDRNQQRVVGNFEIIPGGIPVTAFGEDAQGEVYYMIAAANGQCIYRFSRAQESRPLK